MPHFKNESGLEVKDIGQIWPSVKSATFMQCVRRTPFYSLISSGCTPHIASFGTHPLYPPALSGTTSDHIFQRQRWHLFQILPQSCFPQPANLIKAAYPPSELLCVPLTKANNGSTLPHRQYPSPPPVFIFSINLKRHMSPGKHPIYAMRK